MYTTVQIFKWPTGYSGQGYRGQQVQVAFQDVLKDVLCMVPTKSCHPELAVPNPSWLQRAVYLPRPIDSRTNSYCARTKSCNELSLSSYVKLIADL